MELLKHQTRINSTRHTHRSINDRQAMIQSDKSTVFPKVKNKTCIFLILIHQGSDKLEDMDNGHITQKEC